MSKKLTSGERVRRQIQRLIERDGDLCHYCKNEFDSSPPEENHPLRRSRDHIVPKSYGGMATVDNFVLVHAECNVERDLELYYCGCSFCNSVLDDFFTNKRISIGVSYA